MPTRQRYARAYRLTKGAEFKAVFAKGNKVVGRHFVCYWVRQEEQGSKLGVIASRKVGGAVVRNRVKRLVREYFRLHRDALNFPIELVVIARPASAALDYAGCERSLSGLLGREGIWNG